MAAASAVAVLASLICLLAAQTSGQAQVDITSSKFTVYEVNNPLGVAANQADTQR